jgi:hypothetical protein
MSLCALAHLVFVNHRKPQWRAVQRGSPTVKSDIARNEHLATVVLESYALDDVMVSLHLCGWKLIGPHGERWPLHGRLPASLMWCTTVAAQGREHRWSMAVASAS